MSDFEYGNMYEPLSSRAINPATIRALDHLKGHHADYGFVPLVMSDARRDLAGKSLKPIGGIIVAATVEERGVGVSVETIPTGEISHADYLALWREMAAGLLRHGGIEMQDFSGFLTEAAHASPFLAGVLELSDADESNGTTGFGALFVPAHYMNEGYRTVRADNPRHPDFILENPEAGSTVITAAIFDWATEAQ